MQPDIILITDDERRYVDVNRAAEHAIGLPRESILGHRIEEFFAISAFVAVPAAWHQFLADGQQIGVCELLSNGRKFFYRARAHLISGLHVSVLRAYDPESETEPVEDLNFTGRGLA